MPGPAPVRYRLLATAGLGALVPPAARAALPGPGRLARFARYAACSLVATGTSAVVFTFAYHRFASGPRLASLAAFAAGAVVNFAANRFWAWDRRQREGLGRDVAAYAVVAVATALAATAVTSLADGYARRLALGPDPRTVLVECAYFATYAAMFLVKFVLLDRVVFRSRHQVPSTTRV